LELEVVYIYNGRDEGITRERDWWTEDQYALFGEGYGDEMEEIGEQWSGEIDWKRRRNDK